MRRIGTLVCLALLLALPVQARNEHIGPYVDGVAAAERKDWGTAIAKLQEAIRHQSQEERSIRTRDGLVPYVPHFWMGVALAAQEQWDAALAELQLSEKQGVIQNTTYYAQLRSTRSAIDNRKASSVASVGLEEARTLADGALKKALAAQAKATTAGASRLDEYRQASQKLQDALESRRAGTPEGFQKTAAAATQAEALYASAAQKAGPQQSTPVRRSTPAPARSPVTSPPPVQTPARAEPVEDPLPEPARTERISEPALPDLEPEERVAPTPAVVPQAAPRVPAQRSGDARTDLIVAYRLLAAGDLDQSSSILSSLIIADPRMTDALILRGYARYLQGILRREDRLLRAAEEDFRMALSINPDLHLDESSFSPKAIRFFESLR